MNDPVYELCHVCGGSGLITPDKDKTWELNYCPFCYGDGVVDYIEQIIGKRNKDIMNGMARLAAEKLRDDIDKEIIEGLLKEHGKRKV